MKRFARFCTVLVAIAVIASLCTTAYAAGSVTYDGSSNKFIFEPGTDDSPTSMFENFQNVMPGDKLTEQIEIKNVTSNRYKIKVYLRSLGAQEETDDFLSQMKLTVKPVGKSNLFEAPADETAQLTEWTHLGTLSSGGKITLEVTLEVPITMGNEYQNQLGYIDWEFKIEEIPIDPNRPSTGDTSNLLFYGGLLTISIVGMFMLLLFAKRKKKTEED